MKTTGIWTALHFTKIKKKITSTPPKEKNSWKCFVLHKYLEEKLLRKQACFWEAENEVRSLQGPIHFAIRPSLASVISVTWKGLRKQGQWMYLLTLCPNQLIILALGKYFWIFLCNVALSISMTDISAENKRVLENQRHSGGGSMWRSSKY